MTTPHEAWLGIGDGPGGTLAVQLNDASSYVLQSIAGLFTGQLQITLGIRGDTLDHAWANVNALEQLAEAAAIGSGPSGPNVVLSLHFGSLWTYCDLRSLMLPAPATWVMQAKTAWFPGFVMTADCEPLLRGDAIEDAAVTVTGSALAFARTGIPGTAPARINYTITDNTTGGSVLQALRMASYAPNRPLTPGSFQGIYEASATGSASDVSDATAYGGSYARLNSPSGQWAPVAGAASPTPYADQAGRFDIWALIRSDLGGFGANSPSGVAASIGGIKRIQNRQQSYIRASSGVASTAGLTFWSKPTQGNLLVAQVVSRSALAGLPATPSGWTAVPDSGNSNTQSHLFYKIAGAGEPQTVTFAFPATGTVELAGAEYTGMAAAPLDKSAFSSGVGTAAASGTTTATTQANELVIAALAADATAGFAGFPAAYTEVYDTGAGTMELGYYEKVVSATGTQTLSATATGAANWAGVIASFKGASTSAPSLPAATYQYRITAIDAGGNESLPSDTITFTIYATQGILLNWTAPGGGSPVNHYRVYWQRGLQPWKYLNTPNNVPSYNHTTETGATTANPPSSITSGTQLWRVSVGLGATLLTSYPDQEHTAVVSTWSWQKLASGVILPPSPPAFDGSTRPWWLQVETLTSLGGINADVDAVALLSERQQFSALYLPRNLETPRTWEIGADHFGRQIGVLTDGAGAIVGSVSVIGSVEAGPGDIETVILPEHTGGKVDLAHLSLSVVRQIVPRYKSLAGLT